MKNQLWTMLNVTAFCGILFLMTSVTTPLSQRGNSTSQLSSEQLAMIEGQGCNFFEWFSAAIDWLECYFAQSPYACMQALGHSIACINWVSSHSPSPVNSGSSATTPAAPDPCPEGYQRVGGQQDIYGNWTGYRCGEL
jgi:hypothetical protein